MLAYVKTIALACLLTTPPVTAQAWSLRQTELGQNLYWANPMIDFYGACEDACPVQDVELKSALRDGVEAWGNTPVKPVEVTYLGRVDARPEFVPGGPNQNLIWYGRDEATPDPSVLAVTLWTYSSETGELGDTDIILNAEVPWTLGDVDGSYDLQSAVVHEVGHALGLDHSSEPDAVMAPAMGAQDPPRRVLSDDDIEGLEAIYGQPEEDAELEEEMIVLFACSSSGDVSGQAVGTALILVLLGFGLRRRPIRAGAVIAASLAIAGTPLPASAATVVELDLAELSDLATLVVRGEVVLTETQLIDGRIYTDATVVVEECFAGDCPEATVVRTLGGELGEYVQEVSGTPRLAPGLRVVLFLGGLGQEGTASAPARHIVSLAQGCFVLTGAHGAEVAVRDLSGLVITSATGSRVGEVDWSYASELEDALRGDLNAFETHRIDGAHLMELSND